MTQRAAAVQLLEIAAAVAALHAAHGVEVRTGMGVVMLDRAPRGDQVLVLDTDGGERLADTVLPALGAEPAVVLAAAAGLAVSDGILVDGLGATSAPGQPATTAWSQASAPTARAEFRRLKAEM